jgi:hypothetical protein
VLLQRPRRQASCRSREGNAPEVADEEHEDVSCVIDPDEIALSEKEDDPPDDYLDLNDSALPGFTQFGTFSRSFPPCPRMESMEQGQDPYWPAGMRRFHKHVDVATDYDYFLHFFDHDFFVDGLFEYTRAANPSMLLQLSELWTFLALRMIMACYPHHSVADFFEQYERTPFRAAPYLCDYMKFARFKAINSALRTAPDHDSGRPDKFYRVRAMVQSWQKHQNHYGIQPGYLNCTDECMMEFMNRYAPGWQYVERKPKPYGNVFHAAACGLSRIIFSLELMEGRDRPTWMDPPEFENLFNTNKFNTTKVGGLMLRMAKPLFNSGAVLVHDSGFQSVYAMKELKERGVFASCLMKKKAYFARFTDGQASENFLKHQPFLVPYCKPMQLESFCWRVIAHRDTQHLVQLLSSYGTAESKGSVKSRYHPDTNVKMTFRYSDAASDYFQARSAVDENNKVRQGGLSFEQGWQTRKWHIRMFAFLVGVSETNAKFAAQYFRDQEEDDKSSLLQFRLNVAEHILTLHAAQERAPARKAFRELRILRGEHCLTKIPTGCGRYTGKRDRDHVDGFKKLSGSREGHKWQCQLCKCGRQIRSYCLCNPAQPLCVECYAEHRVEVAKNE